MTNARITVSDPKYPSQLLEAAEEMAASKKFEIAVVTSQMACEIQVERVLRAWFKCRALVDLESAIGDLLPSYNLSNEKLRKLYTSLTGDAIQRQAFWSEYKVLVSLRNKAIHGGARLQHTHAQVSISAAKRMLHHLSRIEQQANERCTSNEVGADNSFGPALPSEAV